MNIKGGFSAAESWAWHRSLIAKKGEVYDPRVVVRILRGESISAADYIDMLGAAARSSQASSARRTL